MTSTAAFLAAVNEQVREVSYRIPVLDPAGNEVDEVPAESFDVDFDGEGSERWELSLTLSDPAWVPKRWSDPLDGRSGLRVRPYWQLRDTSSHAVLFEVPLCTMWLEDPDIEDDGTSVSVTVKGHDAVNRARRGGYGGRTVDISGMTVSAALAVTMEALGVRDYRITASAATVPNPYVLGQLTDPWEDVSELASMAGCDVYADRLGVIVVAPRPDPQTVRGSPPRARGRPALVAIRSWPMGLTPACAGTSIDYGAGILTKRAHPRVRGDVHD